ncbi:GAF domain/GGDEF domain/EAL domain protein, partial [Pseudomonas amygdali pv. tabaci]
MTVSHLATGICPSVAFSPDTTLAANHDRFAGHAPIDALLSAAREQIPDIAWAAYAAGELKCLLGQGDPAVVWPAHIAAEDFDTYCAQSQLHCRVAGQGEGVLGWVLAPMAEKDHPALVDLAARLGSLLQTAALIRAQNTQRVLYEISLLASSTLDRGAFLQGIHEQLSALIDAENFYVALYDQQSRKITYPYYIDRFDDEAMGHETFEFIDADRMSLTGYVLSTGQPLFLEAACIERAKAEGRFFWVGRLPEFWMGAPLKNASDEVFGMVAMQVYDVSRVYSAQDRALFSVVSRHVAMALDRLLRRTDLEQIVALRTQQLSAANDALRQEVRDRERAEHLQSALFQIAELSSQPGDMNELFRSLHMIVGELLVALNFYIALYDSATGEVTFPYYIDEFQPTPPRSRRGQRGFTEYVIGQRRPCLIDYDDARRLESLGEIEVQKNTGRSSSWLGIPLFDGEEVRGVLVVQSYSKDVSYTLRDQELLTFVSRHIDTALSRRSAAEAIHTANVLLEARVRDRTRELDQANARLQHENSHDSLTGLPNRSHLQHRLKQAWQDFCLNGQQLIVMFIDLDRFKMINDSLGH